MKAWLLLLLMAPALAQDLHPGRQPGTVMPQIARGYTEAQLREVAAYFAAQARP